MPELQMIELLAPAKNLECGIAAIDNGADAVYIGAERFGARAAATNSVEDIAALCRYAHMFRAKVYVTVNTIIYDEEMAETRRLLQRLAEAGVDALLVQDMAVVALARQWMEEGVRMPKLHASTQTDNRNAQQVVWLASQGFTRVVLARELSVVEIEDIHRQVPNVELEAFVHGALCVSYSGACYASQYCFGRSANRGECAQFCRLKFSLEDADGKVLARDKHLLSLKDMCRIDSLEELLLAGVTSLKIEGRLKDSDYVKNVVAAYSQKLNQIIRSTPGLYRRASLGKCDYSFAPALQKSFNRGFTDYFLHGRKTDIAAMDSPKATGEKVGQVKAIEGRSIVVAGTTSFANGDGLCFFDAKRQLVGFRVNRAEGNRLFPAQMPEGLKKGATLYRNYDKSFVQMLSMRDSSIRKMDVEWDADYDGQTLTLSMILVETGEKVSVERLMSLDVADKPQQEMMVKQLAKLGNTPFVAINTNVDRVKRFFVPSSVMADMRRMACDDMLKCLATNMGPSCLSINGHICPPTEEIRCLKEAKNVANTMARDYYLQQGVNSIVMAMERQRKNKRLSKIRIMECKHCLRYAMGHCVRHGQSMPVWKEPLNLVMDDKRRFTLEFDCRNCQMNVYAQL
ncbi:MAG: U32 family peptidase [Prevotella sp.]|nr:U32 family peptidase [Prevotella sp.]